MLNQYNPFKANRTEQMKDLWKYYVPFPGLDGTGKPVVVQGGRGSGKTMFFQCNSWQQVLLQIRKSGDSISDLLDKRDFVGIYYRVDTTFVSSMYGRNEDHWDSIFETYFSICILREILKLLSVLKQEMLIDQRKLTFFVNEFSQRINPSSSVRDISDFLAETDLYLDCIEDKINGIESQRITQIRRVTAHRIINDLCIACSELLDRSLLFKVFIDEYETLQEYQQKIINTLIKHSTLPVIFNIGLRPKGMKTKETISKTETIEAPHDYELLTLGIDSNIYQDILREICKKRILMGKESGQIPSEASESIEYYLGNYSIEDELDTLVGPEIELPHIPKLSKLICEYGEDEGLDTSTIDQYCDALCYNAPALNSRVHYALLCKKSPYTPKISELYKAYTENTARYSEWMHTRKYGAVFLLCKELKKDKLYYGFDVYSALSSNIVRYFLELCEQCFRIAFINGYNWDGPISADIQTEAARYVSEYKILDIIGYEPYGHELRVFVQYLGQLFYKLHTDETSTLGEPEPNHFSTKDLSLPFDTNNKLASAIMWNVLQEEEPTKKKQSVLSPETVDYYLTKIYVPYFGISYRAQRKIKLDVDILTGLLSGDESTAKESFNNYFKTTSEKSESAETSAGQFSLFEAHQGG